MSLMYPLFLWFLIPLFLLWWHPQGNFITKVHLVILVLILISLSRPIQKQQKQTTAIHSHAMIIAIDVSYSMQAKDIKPTRYDFAKSCIREILKTNPHDSVMLIAFTSNPLILSPSTSDHPLIVIALESLRPEYILTKGTSLKQLFRKISTLSSRVQNLILFTDGGEKNDLDDLQGLVNPKYTALITVPVATAKGSTLQTSKGTLLKDKGNNLVISTLNPSLKPLTHALGGIYIQPSNVPSTVKEINTALSTFKNNTKNVQKEQYHYQEWFQVPLLLALLLFLLLHTRGIKYLLLLSTLLTFSQASLMDDYHLYKAYTAYEYALYPRAIKHLNAINIRSIESQITLANSYYKTLEFKKSIRIYTSIRSTNPKIKQQIFYNIANAYTSLKEYDKAKSYYAKSLQLGNDEASRHNLNLIMLRTTKKSSLGIAHPKSQNSDSSQSQNEPSSEEERQENKPSSGSGSGEKSATKKEHKKEQALEDNTPPQQKHPLSSKVYDLINKGYIHEKQPW